jgi:hypothetical protein
VAERRSRGAPLGDALAEAARRTGMSEADVLDLALARSAWKSTVAVRIGAGNSRLKWSKTPLPALDNLGELRHATAFNAVDRARIFLDDSAPTALEHADGNWGPAVRRLGSHHASAGATVAALAAAFDKHLAPACRQPRTRADYWRAWRLVVTWAVARQAVHDILPMPLDTLKALTWDMVCFAVPSSQIELVWKSVQARHRQFQLRQPLCEANQYSSWVKMLGSIRGRPLALKLPIQKATVRWLLAWRPTTLAAHRARLLTAVATLACMRVNEVARLQVCDLWFDYLASYGIPGFEGTCSVHIDRRKNDTVRKGHYPALGRSKDPALDIVAQLRTWLRVAGLAVHPACAKRARPAARCPVCPPLFPLTRCAPGGVTVATDRPCSRQQASDWIRWAVSQAGGDSSRFSGISARKGGISTAIEAKVDEAILYLQSGHGQALPARAYMHLTSPDRFLETFEAFGL